MRWCNLNNKSGVIMGVANDRSIAWGIAKVLDEAGARIAFTCASEAFSTRLEKLLPELSGKHKSYLCDVKSDEAISSCFSAIKSDFGNIDFLVHSLAFAQKDFMKDKYSDITRGAFAEALDVSCYSFTAAAREAYGFMNPGGSMLTLSYYGAEKWVQCYNVMGVAKAALESSVRYLAHDFGERQVRVNCISAGPIRTLAASGINRFNLLGKLVVNQAPLKRLVSIEEVGKTALYLLTDLSSGVTGETIYVDSGYSTIGIPSSDILELGNDPELKLPGMLG
jgi:enoyl-[acyl-carrier protein] reductase I